MSELPKTRAHRLFNAAHDAEDIGDLEQARQLFEEAASLDKDSPAPMTCLGIVLLEQGQFQEAIKVSRRVTKRWPTQEAALSTIGQSHMNLGHWRRAEIAFRQSLAIRPEASAWVLLGSILGELGLNFCKIV